MDEPQRVVLVDLDIPFWALTLLFMRAVGAALVAGIAVGGLVFAVGAGIMATLALLARVVSGA